MIARGWLLALAAPQATSDSASAAEGPRQASQRRRVLAAGKHHNRGCFLESARGERSWRLSECPKTCRETSTERISGTPRHSGCWQDAKPGLVRGQSGELEAGGHTDVVRA